MFTKQVARDLLDKLNLHNACRPDSQIGYHYKVSVATMLDLARFLRRCEEELPSDNNQQARAAKQQANWDRAAEMVAAAQRQSRQEADAADLKLRADCSRRDADQAWLGNLEKRTAEYMKYKQEAKRFGIQPNGWEAWCEAFDRRGADRPTASEAFRARQDSEEIVRRNRQEGERIAAAELAKHTEERRLSADRVHQIAEKHREVKNLDAKEAECRAAAEIARQANRPTIQKREAEMADRLRIEKRREEAILADQSLPPWQILVKAQEEQCSGRSPGYWEALAAKIDLIHQAEIDERRIAAIKKLREEDRKRVEEELDAMRQRINLERIKQDAHREFSSWKQMAARDRHHASELQRLADLAARPATVTTVWLGGPWRIDPRCIVKP